MDLHDKHIINTRNNNKLRTHITYSKDEQTGLTIVINNKIPQDILDVPFERFKTEILKICYQIKPITQSKKIW